MTSNAAAALGSAVVPGSLAWSAEAMDVTPGGEAVTLTVVPASVPVVSLVSAQQQPLASGGDDDGENGDFGPRGTGAGAGGSDQQGPIGDDSSTAAIASVEPKRKGSSTDGILVGDTSIIAGRRVLDLHTAVAEEDIIRSVAKVPVDTPEQDTPRTTAARAAPESSDEDNGTDVGGGRSEQEARRVWEINQLLMKAEEEEDTSRARALKAETYEDGDDHSTAGASTTRRSGDGGAVSDQGYVDSSSDENEDDDHDAQPRFKRKRPFRPSKKKSSIRKKQHKTEAKRRHDDQKPASNAQQIEGKSGKKSKDSKKGIRKKEKEEEFPLCDICAYTADFRNLRYQVCSDCGMLVHEACVGMAPYHGSSWKCHACAAVGKVVETREYGFGPSTKTVSLSQMRCRARRCELCGVSDGDHSMHPLFDFDGPFGRQIIYPNPKPHLAWCHSLCGFVLQSFSTTRGCVYPCNQRGEFVGSNGEWRISGGGDVGGNHSKDDVFVTHHFVIAGRQYPEHQEIVYRLRAPESQEPNDYCQVCQRRTGKSLRIPVECSVGNQEEHAGFRNRHKNVGGSSCHNRMHIGCARWSKGRKCQVIFHPGTPDESTGVRRDLICECYCSKHALQMRSATNR